MSKTPKGSRHKSTEDLFEQTVKNMLNTPPPPKKKKGAKKEKPAE